MTLTNPVKSFVINNVAYDVAYKPWVIQTANYAAQVGDRVVANGSAVGFTVTLPANATPGDEVQLLTIGTNAIAVDPAGVNLNGAIAPMQISADRQQLHFIYIGAAGWVAAIGGGASTPTPTPTSPYIAEVQAVIDAILATGATLTTNQKQACNDRIVALKNDGIWAKLIAYYGFLGGTAASHAINWKTPGNYNIIWTGTLTHDANGVQSDFNGYGDTGFNPSLHLGGSTAGFLSFYCRTNSAGNFTDIGALNYENNVAKFWGLSSRWADSNFYYDINRDYSFISSSSSSGHIISNHSSSKLVRLFRAGSQIHSQQLSGNTNISEVNAQIYLFNRSIVGSAPSNYYISSSQRQYSSAGFGLELTQAEAIAFSNSEQVYQTALGRQV